MKFRQKSLILGSLLCLILLLSTIRGVYCSKLQCTLPVLMYHHFAETSTGYTVVSVERFREQMKALKIAGYQTVTIKQILNYVDTGISLPSKPILVTMDDGYTSNIFEVAPILEELEMCATVFVIGINEGEHLYVHSGEPLVPPRFSYEAAAEWVDRGVIDLQCHTFDMHQLASYGYSHRDGMLQLESESENSWHQAIREDLRLFRERREGRVSTTLTALAYPFGYYSRELDELLLTEDIRVTFTIEERNNYLRIGNPNCLRLLGRFNVIEDYSGEAIVQLLEHSS